MATASAKTDEWAHERFSVHAPIPMQMRLAPGISYGSLEGTTFALDLNRDRYLRLGHDAAAALDALAEGQNAPDLEQPGLAALLNAGIVDREVGPSIAPVSLTRPARSALEVAALGSPKIWLARIAFANFRVRWLLYRAGLAATVTILRRERSHAILREDEGQAVGIAQRYAAARRLLPGNRACLAEAFTVSVLLTQDGILHDVAFGVSLAPFAAHAWAQTNVHVLSDRADPVRAFHPVFQL